jgi:hypothetical protein
MSSVITGEDELQKLRDEVQKLRKQLELTQSDTPAQVHVEGPSTPVSLNGIPLNLVILSREPPDTYPRRSRTEEALALSFLVIGLGTAFGFVRFQ